MAPPPNRRPGYSRKAQYGIFFTWLIAVGGVGLAALFLVLSVLDPQSANGMRTLAQEVTAPVTRVTHSVGKAFGHGWSTVTAYFNAASRVRALEAKVRKDRAHLIEAKGIKQENAQLKKLLGLAQTTEEPVAVGELIASTASSTRRLGMLSVGNNRSVTRGMPVRASDGLIGRVLTVGPTTARVLLITDTDSVVPVKRASDGLPAIATGLSDGTIMVKPLNAGVNPFKKGDILITSGNGGLYPPNMPVAVVSAKKDDGALAIPAADPSNASFVLILPIYSPKMIEDASIDPNSEALQQARENGEAGAKPGDGE